MGRLKLISTALVIVGFILFVGGISLSIREPMEYGLCLGIVGIIGYAVSFILRSTTLVEHESVSD